MQHQGLVRPSRFMICYFVVSIALINPPQANLVDAANTTVVFRVSTVLTICFVGGMSYTTYYVHWPLGADSAAVKARGRDMGRVL